MTIYTTQEANADQNVSLVFLQVTLNSVGNLPWKQRPQESIPVGCAPTAP